MAELSRRGLAAIPRSVWALGVVSLCMDFSSELIHSLLPLYMSIGLGASMLTIGVVEGAAEALALIVKVFSGVWSDIVRKRKALVVTGYGIAALTKFIFPLAPTLGWVITARFADRVGKGIRDAPRDALIADITPASVRGASYGLRQALDTVGAISGPLAALLAMAAFADNFRAAFWVAVVPAVICVAVLVFGVHEPPNVGGDRKQATLRLADAKRFPARYWIVVGIAALFTLARFSEAFLVLRAQNVGLRIALVPWVMVIMSAVYAIVVYPVGAAADRGHGAKLLWSGLVALIVADLVLAWAQSPGIVFVGAALWGLHMGLTQGLLSALVAAASPADLRGSAFGIFNLASGLALLLASALAGWLWQAYGPSFTFYAGAAFTALALLALLTRGADVGKLER